MIIDEDILLDAARNGPAMTFEEIAAELGISWQRVQQIYNGAVEKVRTTYNSCMEQWQQVGA